ncbi:MAG: hypothetical protein JW976_02505 [Syntrophaceae bacterium]|nr:hypothetical protein [Syntrophaceae bacterium]
MKHILILLLLFILTGCTTTIKVWNKPGTTQQDFYVDSRQCKAKAQIFSTGTNMKRVISIYNSCMRDKGWDLQEQPLR